MNHWISGSIGVATALLILYLVRRDHLHTRYALWWLPTAFAIAVLGVFPRIADLIAALLGVHYPPVIPVFAGFLAITIKILMMDIERSRNEVKLARLVQRVALLEERLGRVEPRLAQPSTGSDIADGGGSRGTAEGAGEQIVDAVAKGKAEF